MSTPPGLLACLLALLPRPGLCQPGGGGRTWYQEGTTVGAADLAYSYELCLDNGATSQRSFSLSEASQSGQRLVAISNYFKGCQGGRVEAGGYSSVQQRVEQAHPGKVAFYTNMVDGSSTVCNGWANYVLGGAERSILTIFADERHNKKMSYTFFNNNHPRYIIIDGNNVVHHFTSKSASGRTDCALAAYGWSGYEPCVTNGYDDLEAAIPGLLSTLEAPTTMPPTETTTEATTTGLPADPPTPIVPAPVTCAPAFGSKARASEPLMMAMSDPMLSTPTDLEWNPAPQSADHPELWVTNQATAQAAVLVFNATGDHVRTLVRRDRVKDHYMAFVSSISFGRADSMMFATCQDATNTYNGKMNISVGGSSPGNFFMGPTLFTSNASQLVDQMGDGAWNGHEPCDSTSTNDTCFMLHEDMLHETPLCVGIAHDPETSSPFGNVYWAFDGQHGMLVRYDFERPHGPGTGYLAADHGEANVRRYEDVRLHRVPGVPSHMVVDAAHRDLYVADSGASRVLRVDVDSGRRDRDARNEFFIYSSTDIKFDYTIWNCTVYEEFLGPAALAEAGLAEDAGDFVPSGIAITDTLLYVANHATGHIIAVDKYSGAVVDSIDTGRGPGALGGLEIGDGAPYPGHLFFTDISANEVVHVAVGSDDGCPTAPPAGRRVRFDWLSGWAPVDPVQELSVTRGDSLELFWRGTHNVYRMPTEALYESCDFLGAALLGASSPVVFDTTGATSGVVYFSCNRAGHCPSGQKLALTISAPSGSVRRPHAVLECPPPDETVELPPAVDHDPGYMNAEIPYTYGQNESVPCYAPDGRSSFNLDALLMAGHTCHRCLPEPCFNGGTCSGVQEKGFTCSCPPGLGGDMCQFGRAMPPSYSYYKCHEVKAEYRAHFCCGNLDSPQKTRLANLTCRELHDEYMNSECCGFAEKNTSLVKA